MSKLGKLRATKNGYDISGLMFSSLPKVTKALSNAATHFLTHQRGLTTNRAKKLLRLEPKPD